jgi:phosphonate transport system substrate-binding protein
MRQHLCASQAFGSFFFVRWASTSFKHVQGNMCEPKNKLHIVSTNPRMFASSFAVRLQSRECIRRTLQCSRHFSETIPIEIDVKSLPNRTKSKVKSHHENAHFKDMALVLGCVAHNAETQRRWESLAAYLEMNGLEFDYVTYTNYDRLLSALLGGSVQIAWNDALAHSRLIRITHGKCLPLGMRDVDQSKMSHIVVRKDSGVRTLADINGRTVATGPVDSLHAYLMPLYFLKSSGVVDFSTLSVMRFDENIGKHGVLAAGELSVLEALHDKTADVAFLSDDMLKCASSVDRTKNIEVVASTPFYDDFQFDALSSMGLKRAIRFQEAILGHAPTLDGVQKVWLPPRGGLVHTASKSTPEPAHAPPDPRLGYEMVLAALDSFDDPLVRWPGQLHTLDHHPFKKLSFSPKY